MVFHAIHAMTDGTLLGADTAISFRRTLHFIQPASKWVGSFEECSHASGTDRSNSTIIMGAAVAASPALAAMTAGFSSCWPPVAALYGRAILVYRYIYIKRISAAKSEP